MKNARYKSLMAVTEKFKVREVHGPNYTIDAKDKSITCHLCGKTSYNPGDVGHRYCAYCKVYHSPMPHPEHAEDRREHEEGVQAIRAKVSELTGRF